jgi:hypothetical protein
MCRRCDGRGVEFYDDPIYQIVPCGCSGGAVACQNCGGEGQVRCPTCRFAGRLKCTACKAGKVMSFLVVVQTFEPDTQTIPVPCPTLMGGAVVGLLRDADYSPALTLATNACHRTLVLKNGFEPLRSAITRAFAASQPPASADSRLVRQRLVVGVASVLEVGYEYDGEAYTAWFAGTSLTAHIPDSPVTAALPVMARDAVRAWEKGDRKGATGILREVMDMAAADDGCRRAYERIRATIPADLESKAKWLRWRPFLIAGGIAAAVFLVVAAVGIGYAVTKAKRGPTPPAASEPRDGGTGPLAKENAVLLEFRSRSVMLPKGGVTTLRLSVNRLMAAGAADSDLTVRLEAGRGLEVPVEVVVGRGQEEIEIEVRARDEGGVFVVKATVEGANPFLAAECRVTVGGTFDFGGTPPTPPGPPGRR